MQEAAGGIVKQGCWRVAKISGKDTGGTTQDIILIEEDIAHGLECIPNLGRIESKFASGPGIIILNRSSAQHDILDPIRGRPASSRCALDADAPGNVTIGDDLI